MTTTILDRDRAGVTPGSRVASETVARAVVAIGTTVFIAYWIATAMVRWRDLRVGAFDFAFFDQIVWNTSRGDVFASTFIPYNFLGQHGEPILLVFAAAYRLGAGPWSLLVVQAAVCGVAALALFEAARALRIPMLASAAAALAYLANPYLHRALAFDFHPETMVTLPAFGATWAFAAGRSRLGVACALSVLLFKEDAVFVVLALGALAWHLNARRHAVILGGCSVAWAVATVLVLMPHMRDGYPGDLVERYVAILGGREGLDGLAWAASHPLDVARIVATPGHISAAATFIAASGPWLLLAPVMAVMLLPGLGLALLSSHPEQQALAFHYAVELVPVATIAGLFGIRQLIQSLPTGIVAGAVILVATVALPVVGPAPAFALDAPTPAHLVAVERAVAMVGDQRPVSAQSNLASRFAHRQQVWEFPGHWLEADWIVLDRYGFRSSQSLDAGFDAALPGVRECFRLVFEEDGVSVYERTAR